jgi:hypothetical protein
MVFTAPFSSTTVSSTFAIFFLPLVFLVGVAISGVFVASAPALLVLVERLKRPS